MKTYKAVRFAENCIKTSVSSYLNDIEPGWATQISMQAAFKSFQVVIDFKINKIMGNLNKFFKEIRAL